MDSKRDAVVEYAMSLPALSNKEGIITGRLQDYFSGVIAYKLGREYWNTIDPARDETSEVLEERLKLWKISQIIWFGSPYENLEKVAGLQKHGPFYHSGLEFYIYDLVGGDFKRL